MTHSDVGLELEKRELERRELETVLRSGIFDRAPNLELVLTYVCGKYFDGAASQIKEYSIAVDALGRPAEFDQKRDLDSPGRGAPPSKTPSGLLRAEGLANAFASKYLPANTRRGSCRSGPSRRTGSPPRPWRKVRWRRPPRRADPPAMALAKPTPAPAIRTTGSYRKTLFAATIGLAICASAAVIHYAGSGVPGSSAIKPAVSVPQPPPEPRRFVCWPGLRMESTPTARAAFGRATAISREARYSIAETGRSWERASLGFTRRGGKAPSPTTFHWLPACTSSGSISPRRCTARTMRREAGRPPGFSMSSPTASESCRISTSSAKWGRPLRMSARSRTSFPRPTANCT